MVKEVLSAFKEMPRIQTRADRRNGVRSYHPIARIGIRVAEGRCQIGFGDMNERDSAWR